MAEIEKSWLWWAAVGEDPDEYQVSEQTRAAVIATARREFGEAATITIVEATQDGPFNCDIFDDGNMDEVMECFASANADRFGENGCEGVNPDALATFLNKAVQDYMAAHGDDIVRWAFTETRNRETLAGEV